jgi:hypothetical protein
VCILLLFGFLIFYKNSPLAVLSWRMVSKRAMD